MKIISCIPDYIIAAARGQKQEITGPKNIVESLKIASMRMEMDGTITHYQTPEEGRGRIAEWLTRYGWTPDTPLQEGGLVYPIWPKRRKPPKGQRKRQTEGTTNRREIKFIQGPSLEEEMAGEREEDT